MKTRIISGLCMVPLLIFLYLGGYWIMALAIIIGAIGVREFYNGFRAMDINPSDYLAYVMLALLYIIYLVDPKKPELVMGWIVLTVMLSSLLMFNVKKHTPLDAMATMVGIIYIIFFSYHVLLVDSLEGYSIFKWLIVLSAFGSDIFAYFTGVFLGKHKLCPDLSPKKTIEGLIGGLAGSMVLCLVFGLLFAKEYMVSCAIIGLIGAAVSVCGDLTASAYKRKMGIKDYGTLIPGHGGIMDRFDSVLFTAPFVYYYIVIVMEHFGIK